MLSDASTSSVKRPVADDVPSDLRSPRTDTMSNLSLSDFGQDVDTYMSEQGEAEIPSTMVVSSNATNYQSVLPAEKLSIINRQRERPMEIGETWYLIARDWWKRWQKACTGETDKEGSVSEQELGPVNNASLLDEYGNLRKGLVEGIDVEYVSEEIWRSFNTWYVACANCDLIILLSNVRYGPGTHPLPREVIGRGELRQASLELFPPHFLVAKLVPEGQETHGGTPYPPLVLSSGETVATLHGKLADAILPNAQARPIVRVWSLLDSSNTHFESDRVTPQYLEGRMRLLDPKDITIEESGIESGDAFVVELMDQEQHWIIVGKTNVPPKGFPLFNSSDGFFNRMSSASPSATRMITAQTALKKAMGLPRSTTSLSSALKPIVPGTLGLGNMYVRIAILDLLIILRSIGETLAS
jgi:ubiquitin carboxyl-terminal hydrolase 4/11/15